MPLVYRQSNWELRIYADDHYPPHFHIIGPGWSFKMDMETLTLQRARGKISTNTLKEVREWARGNADLLCRKWSEYNERD